MHKTKKRILLFLVYLTLLLSFTACDQGGKENDYGSSTEQTTVETAFTEDVTLTTCETQNYPDTVIIREPTDDNPLQFDFNEALNNLYIDGKRFFPKCLADLGEDFSFQGKAKENMAGEGDAFVADYPTVTDCFLYKGKIVGQVIVEDTLENYGLDSDIIWITISSISAFDPTADEYINSLGIYGFRIGDNCTKSDIRAYFGNETKETPGYLYYETKEGRYIRFAFDDGKYLKHIQVKIK